MKTVIPECLVSMYDLTVPYAFSIQKMRKKLDGELEKLHPCFPERYAADYHIRFHPYRKDGPGVHIRAVVIDRLQLADFRKKNTNCLLYAGSSHLYPVFSEKILRRRFFIAAAALSAVIIFFSALCISKPKAEAVPDDVTAGSAFTGSAAVTDFGSGADCGFINETAVSVPPDYAPFMSSVYRQGGSISSVSWNAGTGELNLMINALYPEQLSDSLLPETECEAAFSSVNFGPVAYREGVPEVQVMLLLSPGENGYSAAFAAPVLPAVRTLMVEHGGLLLAETVSPPSLSGSVPESAWASFAPEFQNLLTAEEAENGGAAVCRLSLARSGGNVELSLLLADETSPSGCPLPFSDLTGVFLDAPGLPYAPSVESEWETALSSHREIGRITREDGSAVVFFHNEEGKIERRIYE